MLLLEEFLAKYLRFFNLETEEKNSYRQIMKATSLFGGVQVFNIIIQIIRSKIIAVLLGPSGMGIAGLLTATTNLISNLTNFGLGTSAVRNVVVANSTDDINTIGKTISVLRRWVWITGILGMILTLASAPWLSQITFGNKNFTLAFIWLSISLLFTQLTTGQLVILQGLRKLNHLAKANLLGTSIGLIVTVPLYYFFRQDGIVPAIILSGLISLILAWFFSQRIFIKKVKITRDDIIIEGKIMLKLGFMLSLSGLTTLGVGYLIRIYISNTGGIGEVGLFNAGFAIINTYVGMIFTAMGTDYYPRLVAVSNDSKQTTQLINQQAEIAILVLAPILVVFLLFIHYAIIFLYSNEFTAINEMIRWAALGIYFKATCWSIGFIFLAKGNSRLFFWSELLGNIYLLITSIVGYKFWGLNGLGISFLVTYFIYTVQVFLISRKKYKYNFSNSFIKQFSFQFFLGLLCFLVVNIMAGIYFYVISTIIIFVSTWYSFKELDKRIGIGQMIHHLWLTYRNKLSNKKLV